MRQVGARDEARLVADYERCGRRCCCREYLKFLKPVSMKMAKTQKATLDPSKISGRCGRLMCCLRYEDQTYEELLLRLPRRNAWVRTAAGLTGRVAEVQVLTQLVRLTLPDTRALVVANEEIVERDLPAPAGGPLAGAPEASGPGVAGPGPSSPMGRERQPRQDSQPSAADDQAPASRAGDRPEGQSDQSRPAEPAAEGAFPSTVPSPPAPGRADVPDQRALPPGRRRRRRRRQRKGGQPPARPTPTDAGPAGGGPAAGPQADQDRSRPRGEDTSQRLTSPGDPA
jgi:hypothetical protein